MKLIVKLFYLTTISDRVNDLVGYQLMLVYESVFFIMQKDTFQEKCIFYCYYS